MCTLIRWLADHVLVVTAQEPILESPSHSGRKVLSYSLLTLRSSWFWVLSHFYCSRGHVVSHLLAAASGLFPSSKTVQNMFVSKQILCWPHSLGGLILRS